MAQLLSDHTSSELLPERSRCESCLIGRRLLYNSTGSSGSGTDGLDRCQTSVLVRSGLTYFPLGIIFSDIKSDESDTDKGQGENGQTDKQ